MWLRDFSIEVATNTIVINTLNHLGKTKPKQTNKIPNKNKNALGLINSEQQLNMNNYSLLVTFS